MSYKKNIELIETRLLSQYLIQKSVNQNFFEKQESVTELFQVIVRHSPNLAYF